jgi:hypothetical protein
MSKSHRGDSGRGITEGGPGRPPFWRTLVSPAERWGWTLVSLKTNTRHTRLKRRRRRSLFVVEPGRITQA